MLCKACVSILFVDQCRLGNRAFIKVSVYEEQKRETTYLFGFRRMSKSWMSSCGNFIFKCTKCGKKSGTEQGLETNISKKCKSKIRH